MHIQAFIPSDKTNWKVLQSQMYQFCFILCICRHKHLDWLKTALLLWVPKQKEQSSLVMVQYPECCSKHRVHTQALLGNCWVKEKCMFLTQSINEVRWPKKKETDQISLLDDYRVFQDLVTTQSITYICCFVRTPQMTQGASSLLSTITVHWILKKRKLHNNL